MKGKKKLLLLYMIAVMVLPISIPVSAASPVAKIGSKNFRSLESALKSVKKGQTIKLLKNVTLKNELTFTKNVKYTLNLNNKTIKSKYSDYITIVKGNIIIKNGTLKASVINVSNSSNATFQKIKYGNSSKSGFVRINLNNKAKALFKKCSMSAVRFEARDRSVLTIDDGKYGDIWNYSTKTLTIKKGNFQKIFNDSKGKTIIYNAAIKADSNDQAYHVGVKKGSMTIRNMNLNTGCAGIIVDKGASLTIKNGQFTTKYKYGSTVLANNGSTVINGGTFKTQTTAINTDGITSSGTLTISPGVKLENCNVGYYNYP